MGYDLGAKRRGRWIVSEGCTDTRKGESLLAADISSPDVLSLVTLRIGPCSRNNQQAEYDHAAHSVQTAFG